MKIRNIATYLSIACVVIFSMIVVVTDNVSAIKCNGIDGGPDYDSVILPCPNSAKNEKNGIDVILNIIKDTLSVLVGIAAVGGVIYGSILYTTAGGSSENTKKGMTIIKDTIIGVIVYILMYVLLNYIIPGGVPQ